MALKSYGESSATIRWHNFRDFLPRKCNRTAISQLSATKWMIVSCLSAYKRSTVPFGDATVTHDAPSWQFPLSVLGRFLRSDKDSRFGFRPGFSVEQHTECLPFVVLKQINDYGSKSWLGSDTWISPWERWVNQSTLPFARVIVESRGHSQKGSKWQWIETRASHIWGRRNRKRLDVE